MRDGLKYGFMVAGMVLAWSIYYAVSKYLVGLTGSALLTGFLLRAAALVFLTAQLLLDRSFSRLFYHFLKRRHSQFVQKLRNPDKYGKERLDDFTQYKQEDFISPDNILIQKSPAHKDHQNNRND